MSERIPEWVDRAMTEYLDRRDAGLPPACRHEWRLIEERHATQRRWYCVHCRAFETTVHAPVSDEPA